MMRLDLCIYLLVGLMLVGCGSNRPYVWVHDLPRTAGSDAHIIGPGDRIYVIVRDQESFSGEFDVRPDGGLIHPVLGRVSVAGQSPPEAAAQLTGQLRGVLVDPQVTISVVAVKPPIVSVLGEVEKSDQFEMMPGEGVLDALAKAGGLTEFADRDQIYVLRARPERQRIRFRYRDLTTGESRSVEFRLHDGDAIVVE